MALGLDLLTTLGLVTSSLIAVVSNSLLLLVFFRRRGLRTVSNRFVINLLVTNLLSAVLLVPLLIADRDASAPDKRGFFANISTQIDVKNATASPHGGNRTKLFFREEKEEIFEGGEIFESDKIVVEDANLEILRREILDYDADFGDGFLCFFAQSSTNLICTASILSILLIGVDQFFAVVHPLRYHSFIDKCKSTVFICVCWMVSVVLASLDALISVDSNFWTFCSNQTVLSMDHDEDLQVFRIVYAVIYFVFVVLTPFLTICVIYVCIYTAAHKNSERMRKSTSATSTANLNTYSQLAAQIESSEESSAEASIPKVRSSPELAGLGTAKDIKVARSASDRTSKNLIISLKCRISNASVFKYREETRAAKISLLVIFMVLICYTPYGLAVLLNTNVYPTKIPNFFNYLSLILLVASNIVSPFLFAYRNRRIQREVLKFLRLLPQKNNASLRRNFREEMHKAHEETEEIRVNENVEMSVATDCRTEHQGKKSILKRVCSKNWTNYKKCNFITVPDSCLDARGSFSSASTQISVED